MLIIFSRRSITEKSHTQRTVPSQQSAERQRRSSDCQCVEKQFPPATAGHL